MQVARTLFSKTRNLKYLRISPINQPASWIKLIADLAPFLPKLETLIIAA